MVNWIGVAAFVAVVTAAGAGAWKVASTYEDAIQRAQKAEDGLEAAKRDLDDRDAKLASWARRAAAWEAAQAAYVEDLNRREAERRASEQRHGAAIAGYREQMEKLTDELDRTCANRRVPAAVDRLLEAGRRAPADP